MCWLRATKKESELIATHHRWKDQFGKAVQVTIRNRTSGQPELRQTFWIYGDRAEAVTRLDVIGAGRKGTNYIAPIVTNSPVYLKHAAPLQCLFVPWDNDMYFR